MSAKIYQQLYFVFIVVLFLAAAPTVMAQSSDQNLPTAVLSNEINGTITALDLGDPRLTRHFYAFEGVPGDLVVTLDSRNLNGDVDIFTAVTFRPLMKIGMYANTASPQVTKGLYLRGRQILILRVEARTPNDESGSYRLRFRGAFEPFSGGIPVAESSEANEAASSNERRTNRLSSVGARIEEPPSSVRETNPNEKSAEETATNTPPSATKPKSKRTNPPRRMARGRAARSTRNKPAGAGTETTKTETAGTETTEEKKEAAGEEKPGAATEPALAAAAKPTGQETPSIQTGAHLIIERKDGTKIDRPMTSVRRVVIERGVIVVVLRSGRIERVPMSTVARMAIEP